MTVQSWNNSWGSAANCFLPKQIIKVEAFFNGDMPSNNTQPTKTDHKTHTNQLTVIE